MHQILISKGTVGVRLSCCEEIYKHYRGYTCIGVGYIGKAVL